jgi:hypothetical protein
MAKKQHLKDLVLSLVKSRSFDILGITQYEKKYGLHQANETISNRLLIIFNETFALSTFHNIIRENKLLLKQFTLAPPLLFTKDELKNSCDIFPIEFYEIIETGTPLYGPAIETLITIEQTNLRLQIESNFRRNRILFQQDYFSRHKNRDSLLQESLEGLILSCRNILTLIDDTTPCQDARDIFIRLSNVIQLDVEIFFKLIRHFQKESLIDKNKWATITDSYLNQIDILTQFIDQYDPNASIEPETIPTDTND